jgi:hypothetical protein
MNERESLFQSRPPITVAYADPPYPGMSHFYKDHPDYGGEVDHGALVARMTDGYDAWALHTASVTLKEVLAICPSTVRIGAWVKTFAAFKPGVNPAYAWEPVIFHGGRNDSSKARATVTDWISHPIALRKGLTGAKPPAVIEWVFRCLGCTAGDSLDDLFPGTGIVQQTWGTFTRQATIHEATA